jgi:endogenous inhibitor of DNA gyrase (YacG/DUF329 family)
MLNSCYQLSGETGLRLGNLGRITPKAYYQSQRTEESMPELTCPDCGEEWSYMGDNPAPSCPECGTDVPAGGPSDEQDPDDTK